MEQLMHQEFTPTNSQHCLHLAHFCLLSIRHAFAKKEHSTKAYVKRPKENQWETTMISNGPPSCTKGEQLLKKIAIQSINQSFNQVFIQRT